jgi:hypothetical protein
MPGIPYRKFKLKDRVSGSANVEIRESENKRGPAFIWATYTDFSDDGAQIINGTKSVTSKAGIMGDFVWPAQLSLAVANPAPKLPASLMGFRVAGTPLPSRVDTEGGYRSRQIRA